MTLTLYELALISGGFTFIGVLLGAWVTNHFAERRDRKNRIISARSTAAVKLISVIAREIADTGIDPEPSRLSNIETAIIEFKRYLTAEEQKQIEETWQKCKTLEYNRAAQAQVWGHAMGASIKKELLEELLKFTERHDKNS